MVPTCAGNSQKYTYAIGRWEGLAAIALDPVLIPVSIIRLPPLTSGNPVV